MERFDLILVILTPIIILFTLIVLPWLYFIYQPIKFLVSLSLVGIGIILTLILLIKKRYRVSDMLNILIATLFSLAGYSIFVFGAYHSFNVVFILIEVVLTVIGIALSFMRLGKNPPQEKPKTEQPATVTYDEDISVPSTTYTQSSGGQRSPGFLRVWREPILYFVSLAVVGIIVMFIMRPIQAGNDFLTNIVMGAGFGILGACCFIGSGRTKFERR